MNFTKDNHLTYSIGGRKYSERYSSHEKYLVELGAVDPDRFARSSYREELLRTAHSVYKEFGKDLILFLSGGTDSEIVLRNFKDAGIDIECVTVRFLNGYNEQDVKESVEIVKELNSKLTILDFDIKEYFYSGEAIEFSEKIQCSQLAYLMTYHHILKMGRPSVMGGEVLLTRDVNTDSKWYYTFRENEDASAIRFSLQYNIPLVNEWFSYTPELLLYYLENSNIQSLVSEKFNYKLTSVSSKNKILKSYFPEVREKIKTNGFEHLRAFNFEAYQNLMSLQIKRLEPSLDGIYIDDVLQQLRRNFQ